MASAFNAQSDPGVVLSSFSFPTVNAEHIANRGVNINTVAPGGGNVTITVEELPCKKEEYLPTLFGPFSRKQLRDAKMTDIE